MAGKKLRITENDVDLSGTHIEPLRITVVLSGGDAYYARLAMERLQMSGSQLGREGVRALLRQWGFLR